MKLPSLPPKVRAAASSKDAALAAEGKVKEEGGEVVEAEVDEWEKPFVSAEEKVKEGASSTEGAEEGKEKDEA